MGSHRLWTCAPERTRAALALLSPPGSHFPARPGPYPDPTITRFPSPHLSPFPTQVSDQAVPTSTLHPFFPPCTMNTNVCVEPGPSPEAPGLPKESHLPEGALNSLVDYNSEMERYRSFATSFYKTNGGAFPQAAKIARITTPIFPSSAAAAAAAARIGMSPWNCDNAAAAAAAAGPACTTGTTPSGWGRLAVRQSRRCKWQILISSPPYPPNTADLWRGNA